MALCQIIILVGLNVQCILYDKTGTNSVYFMTTVYNSLQQSTTEYNRIQQNTTGIILITTPVSYYETGNKVAYIYPTNKRLDKNRCIYIAI